MYKKISNTDVSESQLGLNAKEMMTLVTLDSSEAKSGFTSDM